MLLCIIEDFCHCSVSRCLGLLQTHPRVREESSCSFLTTPSQSQCGFSQPLQSSQRHSDLAFGSPNQGRAQKHPFYLSSLTAPFCTSRINGSLWVQPKGRKKISNDFKRRQIWPLLMLHTFFLHTNNGIADLIFPFQNSVENSSGSHKILSQAVFLVREKGS